MFVEYWKKNVVKANIASVSVNHVNDFILYWCLVLQILFIYFVLM